MAHKLIITAYQPDFTFALKAWITKNINPSMVNPQDDEKSYCLETILQENLMLSLQDSILITELQSQNVEYVEF
jgi:hypothetical protein